ncbi:tyrosine-type recombinase/integrase [Streptomyces sp. 378]|nr:tyrosine-type recombinase/integrase [Streptomyces sp. 378]MDK1348971.1 tyrosine-type recombinase/integrase [Streptomyces sp. 378]
MRVTASSGRRGGQLRRGNFRDDWVKARKAAGVTAELHFHDLRHTGNTLASTAGAGTRELMTRMGHSSSRAALIYQHMTSDRDRAIADRLGAMTRESQDVRCLRTTACPTGDERHGRAHPSLDQPLPVARFSRSSRTRRRT